MTRVEKKEIEKVTVGLVVCAVLVVILAIWFYSSTDSLQKEIIRLETEVNGLQLDKASLESQVSDLDSQIDSLSEPQLHQVNLVWSDFHPDIGNPAITISGNAFNSGTELAYNVILTVEIYDNNDKSLRSEELSLGTIEGKSYQSFDTSIIYFGGDADHVTTSLTFSSIPD